MGVNILENLQKKVIFMNKQLLKEELLKSPLIEWATSYLNNNDEIITIQITGSEASDLVVENSDIDIAIITCSSWNLAPDISGIFQGRSMHWWVTPFDFNFKAYAKPAYIPLLLAGSYYMNFSIENTIWINPKYEKFIEFLRQTKIELKPTIIYNLCEYFTDISNCWQQFNRFEFKKTYIPLIDFYWEQNKLSKDLELLKRAKLKSNLSLNDSLKLKEALVWVSNWSRNQPYTYKLSNLEWQIKATALLHEIKNKKIKNKYKKIIFILYIIIDIYNTFIGF